MVADDENISQLKNYQEDECPYSQYTKGICEKYPQGSFSYNIPHRPVGCKTDRNDYGSGFKKGILAYLSEGILIGKYRLSSRGRFLPNSLYVKGVSGGLRLCRGF
jgi:hypothetical protein